MKKLLTPIPHLLILAITITSVAASAAAQGRSADASDYWGPNFRSNVNRLESIIHRDPPRNTLDRIRYWNSIAIDASGLDHTPVLPGENRVFGEQLGPARASRAIAIVHIAIFDAVNAIRGDYESYTGLPRAHPSTSMDAAIAKAAGVTLNAMFPSQATSFDQLLAEDLARINNVRQRDMGIALGNEAAERILAMRHSDGSAHVEPVYGEGYMPSMEAGKWRKDPISLIPIALGAHWNNVAPFVMESADQFRIPPPPAMDSAEYTAAYNEVKAVGGDGITTPTERTEEQQFIGNYWAYDGTPSLCAPPRMYNQITVQIAKQKGTNAVETSRLLALINVAMADAGIASWESKYHYQFWRPITGIRESDPGTGPSGTGDGNADTVGDVFFSPLGAPASNLTGPNFTPPFPAYPSGHATFGGALFQTLRRFYGSDRIRFTFVSDEYNGVTVDNNGNVREYHPRSFTAFSQAEEENGQSRIYLGIHWSFDKTEGIAQGRNVADLVFESAFTPVEHN
jgi:hypothetical protein